MSAIDFTGKTLTQDEIQERIRDLRLLVLDDDVLKDFRTYDEYLLRFLYFKDFNIKTTFKVMQEYTQLMIKYPKWYPTVLHIDEMCRQQNKLKAIINGRDRSGRRIFIVELGKVDPSKSSPIEEARSDEIWFESIMDEADTQANGVCVLLDIERLPWKLMQWFTPSAVRTSAAKSEIYPCKSLLYHIIGKSPLVSTGMKILWPFISDTTKKSILFHFDNWSSLHEHVSPDILPAKYGGTGPEIDYEDLYAELFTNKDAILDKITVDQKNLQKLF